MLLSLKGLPQNITDDLANFCSVDANFTDDFELELTEDLAKKLKGEFLWQLRYEEHRDLIEIDEERAAELKQEGMEGLSLDWMEDRPDLDEYELYIVVKYISFFMELSADRQLGMDVGPIPWSTIMRHAEHLELTKVETEFHKACIRHLDNIYLEKKADDRKKKETHKSNDEEITPGKKAVYKE